jgi:transcriptional regulator GlxA family with amidase domain
MPISPPIPPQGLRRVELLAYPHVQLLDVAGPLQVFATANDLSARTGGAPPYEPHVVARSRRPIAASAGLRMIPEPLPRDPAVDTLIVAGGPGVGAAAEDPTLCDWLRRRASQARRTASVCTGAFLLAAAGLLDGRRATTHWSFCADLARRYPGITVEPDPIFVQDGNVWTSAGVTAGIDLALALIEQDLGRTRALAVARHLVVFLQRPGGQAQFSAALSLQAADDRFGTLNDWMADNLAQDLSLPALAERAGMSERSLIRHYTAAIGTTPARAVERLRVDAACRLVTESRLPIKRVAQRCGFGTEETMRRSFVRLLKISPQEYRARFGTPEKT